MKLFRCGDVVPGCKSVFEGMEEEEIFAQVTEHARNHHGIQEITPSIRAQVASHIQTFGAEERGRAQVSN